MNLIASSIATKGTKLQHAKYEMGFIHTILSLDKTLKQGTGGLSISRSRDQTPVRICVCVLVRELDNSQTWTYYIQDSTNRVTSCSEI